MIRVLVVEDEQTLRIGIVSLIDWNSLQCEIVGDCTNGLEALELLQHTEVDLVVTDINMPGMDGLELAQALFDRYPSIGVVFLTAYSEFEYARKAIQLQVLRYVLKRDFINGLPPAIKEVVAILQQRSQDSSAYSGNILSPQQLQELLEGRGGHTGKVGRWFAAHNIAANNYCLLLVEVISTQIGGVEQTATLALAQATKKLLEATLEGFPYISDTLANGLQLLIVGQTQEQSGNPTLWRRLFDMLADTNISYMPFSMCLGASELQHSSEELTTAYRQAVGSLGRVYVVSDVTAPPKPFSTGAMPNARLSAEDLLLAFTENDERQLLVTLDRLIGRYRDAGCPIEKLRLEVHDLISACLLHFQEQNIFIDALDNRRATLISDLSATVSPFALWVVLKRHLVEMLRNKRIMQPQGSSIVNQVNQYISSHYSTDINLETIARVIHVNSSYLSRLYKKETGVALTTYLNQYRIQKAKMLLQARKYTVAEVGSMVGINDPAYFTHVFTKYVGQSPKTYSQKQWGNS